MAESEQFSNLVDAGAFISHERQITLVEVVEGHERWDADLNAGTITFLFADRPPLVCEAQLLGSSALQAGSWLWAWANSGMPENATQVARGLKDLGTERGIPEFVQPEVPLDEHGNDGVDAFWYRLTTAVAGLTTTWHAYFRAPSGEGTVAPFLIRHPDLELKPVDFPRVARVLSEGLQSSSIRHHRSAVEAYAQLRGIPAAATAAGLDLTLPEGVLSVEFDELGRVTRLTGTASAAGQA